MRRPETMVHDGTIFGAIQEVLLFWVVTLVSATLIMLCLGIGTKAKERTRSRSSHRDRRRHHPQTGAGSDSGRQEGQEANSDMSDVDAPDGDAPDEAG